MAVVRDVHRPTLSSTSTVTIYIMDANDHSPVWTVPASPLNTTVVRVSSLVSVGTAVARVRAEDADADDNARVSYSVVLDDVNHVEDLPFDVDPDTGIIRLQTDMSATVSNRYFSASPFFKFFKFSLL